MMKGGLVNLMKQAQPIQENMKRAQEELGKVEVEGQAASGLVKIIMTCRHEVRHVSIDGSLLSDDNELSEDLTQPPFNDAARKAETASQERMSSLAGGLPMPPGIKLRF